jgi:hypothetical protein
MPNRVELPGASELFRPTAAAPASARPARTASGRSKKAPARPAEATGRVRHEEKMTVYVSSEELMAIEQARLKLRGQGIAVDRGRFIRGAVISALDDLAARGLNADIVERLGS